jgi:GH15 family glucan-1,4-alpha-glucosidase
VPLAIEHYALIGDCHAAALVGSDGSIDWLCLPRFDSGACFAALLGGPQHGRWLLAHLRRHTDVRRRYTDETLVLETQFETETGCVRVTDFMPLSDERWDVVRIVEGLRGTVNMRMELIVRFDYGSIVPWVRRSGDGLSMTAGPDMLELYATLPVEGEDMTTVATFEVKEGTARILYAELPRLTPSGAAASRPVACSAGYRIALAPVVRPLSVCR